MEDLYVDLETGLNFPAPGEVTGFVYFPQSAPDLISTGLYYLLRVLNLVVFHQSLFEVHWKRSGACPTWALLLAPLMNLGEKASNH